MERDCLQQDMERAGKRAASEVANRGSKVIHVAFECELPAVPNFLRNSQGQTMDVKDCTDEGLRKLGEQWTEAVIARAHNRRATHQMSELTPEKMARMFHAHYERLAPSFDYVTRKDSRVAFDDLPPNNKALMIAVCKKLCEWIDEQADGLDGIERRPVLA